MQRRHFLQLSGAASIAVLLDRLTYAAPGSALLLTDPAEVWMDSGTGQVKLSRTGSSRFGAGEVEVVLKSAGNATAVFVSSPRQPLCTVRLVWKHRLAASSQVLGDHWERSYGDLQWKPNSAGMKYPWYVLLNDSATTACFGVKTAPNSICWWELTADTLELVLDTRSGGDGVVLGNRRLHAADIVTTQSKRGERPFQTDHRFCGMMCEKPRLPRQPVYGINDWYFAYGNNSFDLIRTSTAQMAELASDSNNRPFSVIDAGWAVYSPELPGDGSWNDDFSKPNDKFRDMHRLADEIKRTGMRPGLWMRPLCARHDQKANRLAPKIPGRDNPRNPVLDPTIPENLAYIRHYFDLYKAWGYELVKHDFTTYDITGRWGFSMGDRITPAGWSFNNRHQTNAEIMLGLYRTIRKGAGDGICVLGCNTMSHLSAGLFEICRTGDDTSGKDWARTRKMGVNTLAFRLPQHGKFYAVDADCVGLTNDVPWEKNEQWLRLLAESGTPLFISAQPEAIGAPQKSAIRQAFANAAKALPPGEPLDWMENRLPVKWKLNNKLVTFDWG
ncbi:alpha-amylase family protein [Siphonobacter aquaeclarae]|uniref:Alpha-galactosidase n=1 Tax=Siphonobacter aquaeclarae TaxID=563176 RepID=A0A1G9JRY2_9BACT|nr:hypothetical protein [Siphonobacter aquaeclarae]SDL39924.1 alpha-galactosidase [Siphonobacter aquaeclarae]